VRQDRLLSHNSSLRRPYSGVTTCDFSSARNSNWPRLRYSVVVQNWEYQVYASHLDPAELVVILNESGREGWELVAMVPVTDYYPPHLIEPDTAPSSDVVESTEVIPVEAFRYVFKRPIEAK
jgi:hypothetical protein